MADSPITDLENSKGGERSVLVERSVLAVGIVTACLIVLLLFVGFGGFGYLDKSVAPDTPQQKTESPATTGSQNP